MFSDINRSSPDRWKEDTAASVAQYNDWFFDAAPLAYREARELVQSQVLELMECTDYLRSITVDVIHANPSLIETLRQTTSPPLARDRLTGLSGANKSLLKTLESGCLPTRMSPVELQLQLELLISVIRRMLDRDLVDWLSTKTEPTAKQIELASVVIGDRKTGAMADPVIRNAQEKRQLQKIGNWLKDRGYRLKTHANDIPFAEMEPGTFSLRQNFPAVLENGQCVQMPIDVVIQPWNLFPSRLPLLVEAKCAGDYTNTNKRRKEEATKLGQIRRAHPEANLILFLCGYFDSGYLGYSASEGLDWVWEHRVEDFERAGL